MKQSHSIQNIFKTLNDLEFLSIATIGGVVTFKFITNLYDEIYTPLIDHFIPTTNCSHIYYIGKIPIRCGIVVRDIIKWIVIIMLLIIIYHYYG